MNINDFITEMKNKSDPRFEPFWDFCKKHGLLAKLSLYDIRHIFNFL
jgi:hypothetical protein